MISLNCEYDPEIGELVISKIDGSELGFSVKICKNDNSVILYEIKYDGEHYIGYRENIIDAIEEGLSWT